MPASLFILGISIGSLLLGSAIFGIALGGPIGLLASPLLALFGWPYLIPITLFVTGFYFNVSVRHTAGTPRLLFILAGAFLGGAFMGLFGVKEEGSILRFTVINVGGGTVSGAVAIWCLTEFHPSAKKADDTK